MSAKRPSTWRAVAWALAGRQSDRAFGVVSIAILARLLSPGDFGLVAMAASIAAIVEVLSAFGFDWALIRLPAVTREHYDTAWTLRLISGIIIFIVLSAAAYPASVFFSRPAVLPIVVAMGFNALLGSAGNIWMTEYRRFNRFDREFTLNSASRVAGFVTSIAWAVHTRSYWALVYGTTASRLAMTLLSYGMHPRRPRWDLSRRADLLRFSLWLLLGNATDVLRSRFSDIWIGRVIGSREVGLYSLAQEIAGLASTELAEPVNRAVFATYSQMNGAIVRLRDEYLRVSGLIWSIGMPAAVGIGLCAPDIVAILLGDQWSGATGVLRVLACASVMNIMTANTHYVYWALGRSRFVAMLSGAGAAVFMISAPILGRYDGMIGVARAQVAAAALVLAVNFTVLSKTLELNLAGVLSRNYRVLLASAAMGGMVLAIKPAADAAQLGHWGRLALFAGAGATGYFAALLGFWRLTGGAPGPEEDIWRFLMPVRRMRRPRTAQVRKVVKRLVLYGMRAAGLFAVARRVSRRRLRILCYHGFSIGDQHEYAPIMFMRPAVFARRLALLKRRNYPVLPLGEALGKLRRGEINRGEVVITIDDGWKSTRTLAAPLLLEQGFPACLFLTTYHVERAEAVPDVVIEYMFWRTARTRLSVHGVSAELDGEHSVPGNERNLAARWAGFGNKHCDAAGRQELLRILAGLLDLDLDAVIRDRRFSLIDGDDVTELKRCGIDIQLHSHTHSFPATDYAAAAAEILQNRRVLERLGAGHAVHFCYPSGLYAPQHPQWLERLGIESAMTCDVGSNESTRTPFLLRRYLDRDDARDVEFEAELSGVSDFLRALRGTWGRTSEPPT